MSDKDLEAKLAAHREQRKEVLKQRKDEEKKSRPVIENKLEVNRTPEGLYWLRFTNGGNLPKILQGRFTSIERIKGIVKAKYGDESILV